MMTKVYKHGEVELTIAASDVLSIFSYSPAKVYTRTVTPNHPPVWGLLAEMVAGVEYNSAAFAAATVVKIEAGADDLVYAVGTSPQTFPGTIVKQGAPTAEVAAATLTAAKLMTGIITITHATGAPVALTLETGANLDAALSMGVGEAFDWSVINPSAAAADTGVVTASAGHTLVGLGSVASAHATTGLLTGGNVGRFRTRKTAADTFITYRIA